MNDGHEGDRQRSDDGDSSRVPFRLLTKKRVAEMLGCTVRTVDHKIAAGIIPYIKLPIGGGRTKTRFHPHAIIQWMTQHHQDTMENPPPKPKRRSSREICAEQREFAEQIRRMEERSRRIMELRGH